MFDFLKYNIWPWVKVKSMYCWWIIKYGGKKNIPPELIFEQMQKTMDGLTNDLMGAFRSIPHDATEQEKRELYDIIKKVGKMKAEINDIFSANKNKQEEKEIRK